MSVRKLPYREGDWFAIPLVGSGFAVGLIARSPRGGKVLFGYFFGPRKLSLPRLIDLAHYKCQDAILVAKFGDYSLFHGEWPVLGSLGKWLRNDWPMPSFSRVDEKKRAVKVAYSEEDPTKCLIEQPCPIEEAVDLPEDSMLGSHIVTRRLSKLLPS
jgi:hypothetical protein